MSLPASPAWPRTVSPRLENLLRLGHFAVGGWVALRLKDEPTVQAAAGIEPAAVPAAGAMLEIPLAGELGCLMVGQSGQQSLTASQQEAATLLATQLSMLLQSEGVQARPAPPPLRSDYQHLASALPQALLVVDRQGRFFTANRAFDALPLQAGRPPVTLAPRGTDLATLVSPALKEELDRLRSQLHPHSRPLVAAWSEGTAHYRITAMPLVRPEQPPGNIAYHIEDTSERQRMRAALQERNRALEASHSELSALLDATGTAILMSDSDGIIRHANRAVASLLRLPLHELVDQPVRAVMARAAERFDNPANFLQRAEWLYDHPRVVARDYLKTRAARPLFFERYSAPVYSAIGTDAPPGRIEVFTNQTRHRRMEATLREHNASISQHLARHRALYEIGTEAIAAIEAAPPLETLMSHVTTLFGADGMAMLMPSGSGIRVVASTGLSAEYLRAEQAQFTSTAASRAVRERSPIVLKDAWEDPHQAPLHGALREEGIRTVLYVPLIYRDEEVGLLGLYHREPHHYLTEEMESLAIFASQATSILKMSQLYESLREGQQQLDAILNSMTDGVVALDEEGRIIFTNEALISLLRLRSDRMAWQGCALGELPEPLAQVVALGMEQARAPYPLTASAELELPQLSRLLRVMGRPIIADDGLQGTVVLLHDVTESRRNEETKENLIATISHELRTPLTSIIGYSSLLANRPDAPMERRVGWARMLQSKGKQLQQELDDLLDYVTFLRRHVALGYSSVDLATLIEGAIARAAEAFPTHHVVADVVPLPPLLADARRIEKVLDNLLSNALQYSSEGSRVTVRLRGQASWVILSVHDEGMGIAPHHLERIFEPFYRVNNQLDRSVYGNGLGLPLSRSIIRAHGGELILKSTLGQGTTAVLSLPRRANVEGSG